MKTLSRIVLVAGMVVATCLSVGSYQHPAHAQSQCLIGHACIPGVGTYSNCEEYNGDCQCCSPTEGCYYESNCFE